MTPSIEETYTLEEQVLALQTAQRRDRERIGQLEDALTLVIQAIDEVHAHLRVITPKYA